MYRIIINSLILICILNIVKNSNAAAAADPVDPPEVTPKLAQCKLTSKDMELLKKGDKGDKGESGRNGIDGAQGVKGPPGERGEKGNDGKPGVNGLDGKLGPKGDKGEVGPAGPPGPRGEKGEQGLGIQGSRGLDGKDGIQGLKGEKGVMGPPGPIGSPGEKGEKGSNGNPGTNGINGVQGLPGTAGARGEDCVYKYTDDETVTADGLDGSEINPLQTVCKNSAAVPAAKHYIKPKELIKKFEVHCQNENKLTCLLPKKLDHVFEAKTDKKYWLSADPEWTMKNIYGLETDIIVWLQRHSHSVKQTIKYHCMNSVPINLSDTSKSVKLMTFNDILIGPDKSETTPLYYTVQNDECKNSANEKTKWFSTELIISSKLSNRLPIADIQINEMKDGAKIFIEHVELCFG